MRAFLFIATFWSLYLVFFSCSNLDLIETDHKLNSMFIPKIIAVKAKVIVWKWQSLNITAENWYPVVCWEMLQWAIGSLRLWSKHFFAAVLVFHNLHTWRAVQKKNESIYIDNLSNLHPYIFLKRKISISPYLIFGSSHSKGTLTVCRWKY